MKPSRFKDLYAQLNPQQREAVDSETSRVVIAGPGSGKTRIICLKAAHLYSSDEPVACISFGNYAVEKINEELALLGVRNFDRCFVGTLHSFCLTQIILPFSTRFADRLPPKYGIASQIQLREILLQIGEALLESRGRHRSNIEAGLVQCLEGSKEEVERKLINFYTYTMNPMRNRAILGEVEKDPLIVTFDSLMYENQLLDFEMIVELAVGFVRDFQIVRDYLKERFTWLLVDEYQDLGASLHALAVAIHELANLKLLIVGDPNQLIYSSNGAKPEYIYSLKNITSFSPPIETIYCYRFGQKLIDASGAIIKRSLDYKPSDPTKNTEVHFIEKQNLNEQSNWVVGELIPEILFETENENKQIAILYRQKGEVPDSIRASFDNKRVNSSEIQYFDERFTELSSSPFVIWLRRCADWSLSVQSMKVDSLNKFREISNYYLDIYKSAGRFLSSDEAYELEVMLQKFLLEMKTRKTDNASEWFEEFYYLLDVERLLLLAGNRYGDILEYKELINSATAFDVDQVSLKPRMGNLVLTTMHAAKGREFDYVIVPGVQHGLIPWTNARDEQEARRLFYVACTRAKKALYIVYSDLTDILMPYGDIRECPLSPFIVEMKNALSIKH